MRRYSNGMDRLSFLIFLLLVSAGVISALQTCSGRILCLYDASNQKRGTCRCVGRDGDPVTSGIILPGHVNEFGLPVPKDTPVVKSYSSPVTHIAKGLGKIIQRPLNARRQALKPGKDDPNCDRKNGTYGRNGPIVDDSFQEKEARTDSETGDGVTSPPVIRRNREYRWPGIPGITGRRGSVDDAIAAPAVSYAPAEEAIEVVDGASEIHEIESTGQRGRTTGVRSRGGPLGRKGQERDVVGRSGPEGRAAESNPSDPDRGLERLVCRPIKRRLASIE